MSERQFDSLNFRKALEKEAYPGKVALWLSSWFGTGLFPKAPGTFGTLGAVPLVLGAQSFKPLFYALGLGAFILIAVWVSDRTEKILGRPDPQEVVIDEVAGLLLTFFLLPLSWFSLVLGFILFRIFDILKPFPAGRLERIGGGLGIVLDDLMAGFYTNLALRACLLLLNA